MSEASAPRNAEKRRLWEFAITEAGPWEWRVTSPDGSKTSSGPGFLTLKACVDDAKKYGYVYGIRRGVMMSDLVSGQRKRSERGDMELKDPDSMKMLQLLRDLVCCTPGNEKAIRELQRETRKVLGLDGVFSHAGRTL